MKRQYIVGIAATLVLIGVIAGVGALYLKERRQTTQLEAQLRELSEKEKRLTIERSVSAQMEEIAYEQKAMSDEQRETANEQARIANEMKMQSDLERQHALIAQAQAQTSAHEALEASRRAERQQELAEQQREQAELARRKTDTLNYQTLARSLGSLSTTQWNLGNHELSTLLAYASYNFARRYHADLYQPAIYEALMQASNSSRRWPVGVGAIAKIIQHTSDSNCFITISTYGEVMQHELAGANLQTQVIFKDKRYDFRDFVEDSNGSLFVVSRTGQLLHISNTSVATYQVPEASHPYRIYKLDDNRLLVVAERSLHVFNKQSKKFEAPIALPFRSYAVGQNQQEFIIFGKGRDIVKIQKHDLKLKTGKLPFEGQVFSYAYSPKTGAETYGMVSGAIYYVDRQGQQRRLLDHRSRVSSVSFYGARLFSASFDGTVNLWDFSLAKVDPIRLLTTNNWTVSFVLNRETQCMWTGDQNGNLTRTLLDVQQMGSQIKQQLKRNLSREEWSQYVGENIPYETFK